jgi:hypothetical protein
VTGFRRGFSVLSRGGLAAALFLLVGALLRLGPVYASPPFPVSALAVAPWVLLFAIAAALSGGPRRRWRWRPIALGLFGAAAALALIVSVRGSAGLAGHASAGEASLRLPLGPIELIGDDLDSLPRARRTFARWSGRLRAPVSGTFGLWASGRGLVRVRLDGRQVLTGDGERLDVAASFAMERGPHLLDVEYERVGPGPRLRLGWETPHAGVLRLPVRETIPPRHLGEPRSFVWWAAIDALALLLAALAALLALALPWDAPRPLPAPRAVSFREATPAFAGLCAIVAAMSWPLATDLSGSGVFDRPDGRLNAWILAWDAHALLRSPPRLFQAPIFHPLPDALAFSENLLLPAALSIPAQLASGPALAYNLALLLGDAISGLGVYLLVRRAAGDRLAAFVAGAFFAAGIHRWVNMAHLHAQATWFLPFALLAFDRFLERRTLRAGLLVGLLLALQGMSSIYLGAITATLLGVATAIALVSENWRGAELWRLMAGFALAGLLLWPLAEPYLRMRATQGEEFGIETVAAYATTPESYVASAGRFYEGLSRRHLDPERVRDPLFPGVLPIALGIAGLAVAPRRYAALALLGSLVAVVLSLGPASGFYRFLHENVVFFRGIRALARFSIVPVLALSVLLGLALSGRRWLRLLALVLLLAEANLTPIAYGRYQPAGPAARWLAERQGGVAYLPLGEGDTQAMLESVAHFRPLLNGDSGFVPRPYTRAMELLNDRFGPEALRLLRALDVRHVVSSRELPLPRAASFDGTFIYDVPTGEAARMPPPAAPAPSLFTAQGPVLDLGAEQAVARVVFEVGDGDWLERPRVEASSDGRVWQDVAGEASLADATLSLYRDPRRGRGEVRFPSLRARFLRLDRRLPARRLPLSVAP